MSDHIVVFCTVGKTQDAGALALALVEQRLVACVNIVPVVTSIYRWRGKIERDEEQLLVMKTRADRFEELRAAIVARHSYEVPEIVALPLVAGHAPYLAWIDESVG
jgi:periplasmic divalent cation tolerance protein